MSIINFHVGFPALTNVKENFPMEKRICFEILQSVIHNIYFIQYSHLLHPIKWLVFILTVSNLRLLSSLVIYNLFPLHEPLTFLSCITHHSHLHYSSLSSASLITLACFQIKARPPKFLDIKQMVVADLVRDKRLIVDLFQKCGREELKFIVTTGLWGGDYLIDKFM